MDEASLQTANRLHDEGQALMDTDEVAAIEKFEQALEIQPDKAETHYNLGLIYKYRADWERSRRNNVEAARCDPENEAALWNLAIAATALSDWRLARDCWGQLQIQVPDGEGAIHADFGPTPVRLNPEADGEVVWGVRLCPVRARILNIPFSDSGFHYGDIVLHDGAATGEREWQGETYPVFNVFQVHERSPFQTYALEIEAEEQEALAELASKVSEIGALEDWSKNVRALCRQCSEGLVHESCDEELTLPESWHRVAVAVRDDCEMDQVKVWATELKITIQTDT